MHLHRSEMGDHYVHCNSNEIQLITEKYEQLQQKNE